ncbi:BRAP2 RING ZnF UBP domain-containing protein 1 isoform X2 [Beta vulgaris subsp. vulgaris]|uniref:BRAP2 RING ZnF UBP domain-containing protein 1 isoform X2 n=1 Tax=Beta vulgaris subsp. vulgaris TaxID=3555 RepID=UPI0020375B78|nr:BRAP2 RING ZnF UBP domain-containing protein 1 isoform X2 [Beta vulgaris subsp. vulgaris]
MFTIRIHSVDTDHPLFLSFPSNSNPNPNPQFVERRGIIHLFRTLVNNPSTSDSSTSTTRSTLLFIVAVPNYFSSDDLLRFFGSHIADISEFFIIRNDGMEDRYSVLIRTGNQIAADAFYRTFNGKRFSPPEVEICHILFALSVEFTELAEIASTAPPGYVELPTCPICLERLDQDTSGIQSTLCDHSFQCSCISKWTYLSCQVCRLCQQQDDTLNCSVCDTSENLWVCIVCGFVGCGRYKEGHTFKHWKDTQHCYSLNLETQRVWDYEGDNYVHRLNHSKADGKSVVADSQCMSHDGDCGACGDGEDSEMTGALFSSKFEAITDEYNHLLATQLENQRQYYESLLVEARSKKECSIAEAVENAVTTRMQDLQCRLEICEDDKKSVLNMNHVLMKAQEEYKKKIKEIEERELKSLRSREEQILDMEEQIRDLKIYIEAQRKFGSITDSDGIKGGTVLPVPQMQSTPANTKRRVKSGRHRN